MPKGTGMEIIIKQATELGVSRITPVVSDRTLLRPGEGKIDRWRKIAQEAAELACRSWIPQIDPPVPLAEFLALDCSRKYMGVTTPAPPLLELLLTNVENSGIILLTGPEGGWTKLEQQTAVERGWQLISLAPTILSATTAPVVALAITVAVLYY
jgi:16S rRNA (uracil1498-N3)-methyltransferase